MVTDDSTINLEGREPFDGEHLFAGFGLLKTIWPTDEPHEDHSEGGALGSQYCICGADSDARTRLPHEPTGVHPAPFARAYPLPRNATHPPVKLCNPQ